MKLLHEKNFDMRFHVFSTPFLAEVCNIDGGLIGNFTD